MTETEMPPRLTADGIAVGVVLGTWLAYWGGDLGVLAGAIGGLFVLVMVWGGRYQYDQLGQSADGGALRGDADE